MARPNVHVKCKCFCGSKTVDKEPFFFSSKSLAMFLIFQNFARQVIILVIKESYDWCFCSSDITLCWVVHAMSLLSFHNTAVQAFSLKYHLILRWEIGPLLMIAPIHTCSYAGNVDCLYERGFGEFYNVLFVCFFNNMCRIRKYCSLAPISSSTKNNSFEKS